MSINTEKFSVTMREKAIDVPNQRLLVTNLRGSQQEEDLSEPANCGGYGRVRHFRRIGAAGWPENPLPIDPASRKLGLSREDVLKAQVFQNAACNWRCWYCFVPFNLLNASREHSGWLTAGEMLDLYQRETDAPAVIDLSGGQPDLTPEWVPWMMRELQHRGLDQKVYLWSDDNLSNDYFWRFLTAEDISLVRGYVNYGKVCCFKGFNAESFAFNTAAAPELFEQQFALFRRYVELEIDLYAYATFTAPHDKEIESEMRRFVDRLQAISPKLPLRVVPLEVRAFAPVHERMGADHHRSLEVQWSAIRCWNAELELRFSTELRREPIYAIPL
jgi:uncharacterized Fe-S cluster-containing radical SAM superfamily protein